MVRLVSGALATAISLLFASGSSWAQKAGWSVESASARARLPLYRHVPAAAPDELTPALGYPPALHGSWHRSHGNNYNTRFSELQHINRANVTHLRMAWEYRSGDRDRQMTDNLQVNPIVVDGVLFGPTMGHHVVAVNAASGKELWRFRPGDRPAFRGLTYHPGDKHAPRALLFNAGDSLWALDPGSGKPLAGIGDGGRIRTGHFRVAPAVHQGLAIVAGYDRDVMAFDLRTGQRVWTFHTIPRKGEPGHETWDPVDEGANAWGGLALDDQRGLVIVGTGSPKPNFVGAHHLGQNLYANCLIAVDARTGKKRWHFQEIAHDIWDLDIPSAPVLVSVRRHGRMVDAVAAVTKMGNTLLVDRVNGKPLFPFRLRRAPTSRLPGERTWPYQPDVELPQPFARQEFTIDEVTDISPEAREYILNKIRPMNYGWFRPFDLGRPTVLFGLLGGGEWTGAAFDPRSGFLYVTAQDVPSHTTVVPVDAVPPRRPGETPTAGEQVYTTFCVACHGPDRRGVGIAPPILALRHRLRDDDVIKLLATGRNAMPAAPLTPEQRTSLLDFLFDRDRPEARKPAKRAARPSYTFLGYNRLYDQEGYPGSKPPWGTLNAIDLNTGRIVWKTVLGEHEELTRRGVPKTGTMNMGGATVTAGGLVFASGTKDNMIRAFDAATGDELWAAKLPFRGTAAPTVYEVGGKQYVVVAATGGGKLGGKLGDAYVAFTLAEPEARKAAP